MTTARSAVLISAALGACTPMPPTGSADSPAPRENALTDPFAYCTAVGTIDEVDSRYNGPTEPQAIRARLPMEGAFTWRCYQGKVLACSYGANLSCAKGNSDRTPTPAEVKFCQENPTDPVPAYITGHDSLFEWVCHGGNPVIMRQHSLMDDRGFVREYWREIR